MPCDRPALPLQDYPPLPVPVPAGSRLRDSSDRPCGLPPAIPPPPPGCPVDRPGPRAGAGHLDLLDAVPESVGNGHPPPSGGQPDAMPWPGPAGNHPIPRRSHCPPRYRCHSLYLRAAAVCSWWGYKTLKPLGLGLMQRNSYNIAIRSAVAHQERHAPNAHHSGRTELRCGA